jgi:AGZA family xanthine/uracil permease-like MFS transporter
MADDTRPGTGSTEGTMSERNAEANDSVVARYFGFAEHGTDLRTEITAGITTFLAMAYIIVVNPAILAGTPGSDGNPGIVIQGYTPVEVQQMLTVITIISSVIALLAMAFYANRPFGIAPGLGLNAFFAFTVVGTLGIPWETALAAVFTEGVIFIILTVIGARTYIIRLFPDPVKYAIGTGIGLYIAIIGLQAMEVVVNDPATLVTLGNIASNPVALLAVFGLFITLVLYGRGIRGSIVIGIVLTTVLGYLATVAGLVNSGVLFPKSLPSAQYDITPLVGAFVRGFGDIDGFAFALVVFTFFFVDFFDTAGTLVGVGQAGGFLNEEGNFPDIDKPLMADAVGTTAGGILGTSTVTTFVESATGVEEGGRTGMTALVIAVLFLVALVFVPFAAVIPQYASNIALVVVALLMLRNVVDIEWDNIAHAIPAGLTILIMPLTYSIAYGIAAGLISYPIMKTATGEYDDINAGQWVIAAAFVVYFYVRTSGILQGVV